MKVVISVTWGCAAQSKKIQLMTAALGGYFSRISPMRTSEAITAMRENFLCHHKEAFCLGNAKPYSIRERDALDARIASNPRRKFDDLLSNRTARNACGHRACRRALCSCSRAG